MAPLVTLSMKLRVDNSMLQWLSTHIFSIHILQRIPFLVLSHLGLNGSKFQFVIFSFLFTCILAVLFDAATARLDRLLYSRKPPKPAQEIKKEKPKGFSFLCRKTAVFPSESYG